ncbi:MAG: CHAT domain-containing protein [Gemmatimonadetes bacterium]|nr:CHAT domain-containing protein [Gemmatimonadota bacterium]
MLLIVVALGIGVAWGWRGSARSDLAGDLAALASRGGTGITPRLSILPDPPVRSGTVPARQVAALVRRLGTLADSGDARALHLRALADLMWSSPREVRPVDRAIEWLHTAERLEGGSAALYSDLAAAHMVRAERAQSAYDLVLAIQFAEQAVALDPRSRAGAYNRALALDRFHLRYQAAEAWQTVLALGGPAAVAEARLRLRSLQSGGPRRPAADAPAAALAAFAGREPQWARGWATDTLLPAWGTAVASGDSALATGRLRAAAALGGALQSRPGDGTVAQAVHDIRRVEANPAALRRLAGAWAEYGAAAAALDQRREQVPVALFQRVREQARGSPVLRDWAEYHYGVSLFYAGDAAAAAPVFVRLSSAVDAGRFPALAGRTRWSLGTLALRGGDYAAARPHLAQAIRLFEQAAEAENRGAMQAMLGEVLFALGQDAEAYTSMHAGLATLRPHGRSLRRHNLLFGLVHYTTVEGLNHAALAIQSEDIAAAAAQGPGVRAEALLSRARALAAAGRYSGAAADVQASVPLLDSIAGPRQRAWLGADQRTARAALQVPTRPHAAAAALDSVVAALREDVAVERLLIALTQRAEARVAVGDARGGAADLDSAAQVIGRLSGGVAHAALRASMLDARRRVFDRLALLHVRDGRPRDALLALERSRAPVSGSAGGARPRPGRIGSGRGEAAVEYALIGDTLLAFAVADTAVWLERRTVDGDGLRRMAEAARTRLELRMADGATSAMLARLYDVLVRPVQGYLAGHERLAVVVDGELAAVPFAALRDTARDRYLVESHVLRLAPALAAEPGRRRGAEGRTRAVFVADPAFRPAEFPALQRLPEALPETRALSAAYPGSVLLSGDSASARRVRAALASSSLFHFAGHAVFDDARPERSYLVLTPDASGAGRLSAEQIDDMDLRGLRLVVLAACQTQRSGSGRSGGFAGLSGAMLRAGAGGVVGSLWRVDDGLTRELMTGFHDAYRATGDAAAALRQAQLRLLGSPDATLRSPAAWSGFRYAGE